MQEVKILRLTTGEDVIAKVEQGSGDLVTLNKPFVIILCLFSFLKVQLLKGSSFLFKSWIFIGLILEIMGSNSSISALINSTSRFSLF